MPFLIQYLLKLSISLAVVFFFFKNIKGRVTVYKLYRY